MAIEVDLRWAVQLTLSVLLLSALAIGAFRDNPLTRRGFLLFCGALFVALPFVLAATSGWYWEVPYEGKALSLTGTVSVPWALALLWIVVALGRNALTLRSVWRTRRSIRGLPMLEDGHLNGLVDELAGRLDFRRPVRLHLGPLNGSSSLAGMRLVMSKPVVDGDSSTVAAVIAHELTHLKRRDDLALVALTLVLDWYWFVPWRRALRDHFISAMEQSCDDRAADLFDRPTDYLDEVFKVARSTPDPYVLATALGGGDLVARFRRFGAARPRDFDVGRMYWGVVPAFALVWLVTSVELVTPRANALSWPSADAYLETPIPFRGVTYPLVRETVIAGERRLEEGVEPIYPGAALRSGVEGTVVVEYRVAVDGRVVRPRVVAAQPVGVFEAATLRALSRRVYERASGWGAEPLVRRFSFSIDTR